MENSLRTRASTRLLFNEQELQVRELFMEYDVDDSGAIEVSELRQLLKDVRGGTEPSSRELEWIMKLADKDKSADISEDELLDALLAWHGYMNLPEEYNAIFEEFDWDANGSLDVSELQGALTRIAGTDVSEKDAAEVLKTADVLADGVVNKEEFLGAVGTWYVNVGRQPTHAMSIAFVALNRTPYGPNCCCLAIFAGINVLMGYFALDAAIGAGYACGYFLPNLLAADGVLWLVYAVFLVMKGRWVQALNVCLPLSRSAKVVSHVAGAIVIIELGVMGALLLIECVGLFYAFTEAEAKAKKCQSSHTTENIEALPSNIIGFSQQWFSLWALPCTVITLAYLIYCVIKIRRSFDHERDLQGYASSDEESGSSDNQG